MANHILKQEGKALIGLFKTVAKLRELNQLFASYVDTQLASHCAVVNMINGSLIILAENGHWATQLRFEIPNLLEKFRQHPEWCSLASITCKTHPNIKVNFFTKKRRRPPMQKLSLKTASIISEHAETIQDETLKRILKQIAGRVT